MIQYIIIFITTASKSEARKISDSLLDRHLIACANIIDGVDSYFWWKDRKEKAKECLIIAKTVKPAFKGLVKIVRRIHSYETPEIIAIPITAGSPDYLDWIGRNTYRWTKPGA